MANQRKLSPDDPDFVDRVAKIAVEAVEHAIAQHHAAGRAVYYRRNGRLVKVTPDGRETPVDSALAHGATSARTAFDGL